MITLHKGESVAQAKQRFRDAETSGSGDAHFHLHLGGPPPASGGGGRDMQPSRTRTSDYQVVERLPALEPGYVYYLEEASEEDGTVALVVVTEGELDTKNAAGLPVSTGDCRGGPGLTLPRRAGDRDLTHALYKPDIMLSRIQESNLAARRTGDQNAAPPASTSGGQSALLAAQNAANRKFYRRG